MSKPQEPAPSVAVLLGVARSGTTLLRLMLDSHSEIASPAEAGLPALCMYLENVWRIVTSSRAGQELQVGELPPAAREGIATAMTTITNYYCEVGQKRIYCDKSLDSAQGLDAVHRTFPNTRYILQFRHVMDVIASGIEASPWGFSRFGYGPFVQQSPENLVAALAQHWLANVSAAVEWERRHPSSCCRVRYEDLVAAPDRVYASVVSFLGAAAEPLDVSRVLAGSRWAVGPGDYKLSHTRSIEEDSLGRGKRVPIELLPEPLRSAVNHALVELGYEPLAASWNAEPYKGTRRDASGLAEARLTAWIDEAEIERRDGRRCPRTFAIAVEGSEDLRWVVDPAAGVVTRGHGQADCAVIGRAEDLLTLLRGETNPGVLLRQGRVRHLSGRVSAHPSEVATTLRMIVETFDPAQAAHPDRVQA